MADIGGGAGGIQPSGPESDASDPVSKAARSSMSDSRDSAGQGRAKTGPGAEHDQSQSRGASAASGGATGGGPALGAGGTSQVVKDTTGGNLRGVAKGTGATVAVPAAGVGSQAAIVAMFLNWLKGFWAAVAAVMMNLANAMLYGVFAALPYLAAGFLALGTGLTAVVGVAGSLAGAVVAGAAGVLLFLGVGAGGVQTVQEEENTAQRDAMPPDCREETEAIAAEIDANAQAQADIDTMEDTAERVYAILSGLGMADENIAGVLGNFHLESQMDPTTVETIMTEPYEVGPRTQAAEESGFRIADINPKYANDYKGITLAGIGLGQWTNNRNTLLTEYADQSDGEWSDLEVQLSFMLSDDDASRVQFVHDLIEDSSGSIDSATQDWMVQWEGLTLESQENRDRLSERQESSRLWFTQMQHWEADEDLAEAILEEAVVTGDMEASEFGGDGGTGRGSLLEQMQVSADWAEQNRRNALLQQCRTADVDGEGAQSGAVVQAGETIPCDSLGGAHPDACTLHEHLQDEFEGFFLEAGSQRNEPGSNHHNGQAIDYMMAPLGEEADDKMKESGTEIINYILPRAEEFNIKGIIWQKRVWAAGRDPVAEWTDENMRDYGERDDVTQNHMDHIHISVGPDQFK